MRKQRTSLSSNYVIFKIIYTLQCTFTVSLAKHLIGLTLAMGSNSKQSATGAKMGYCHTINIASNPSLGHGR